MIEDKAWLKTQDNYIPTQLLHRVKRVERAEVVR